MSNFNSSIFSNIETSEVVDLNQYKFRFVIELPNKQSKRKDFTKSKSGVMLAGYDTVKSNGSKSETLTLVRDQKGTSVFYSGHNEYVERRTKKGEWVGRSFNQMVEAVIQEMMEEDGITEGFPQVSRLVPNTEFQIGGTEPSLIIDPTQVQSEVNLVNTKYYANPDITTVNGVKMALRPSNTLTGKKYAEGVLKRMEVYFNAIEADPKFTSREVKIGDEMVEMTTIRIDLHQVAINLVYEEVETIDEEILDKASLKAKVISTDQIKLEKAKKRAEMWSIASKKASSLPKMVRTAKTEEPKPEDSLVDLEEIDESIL